MPKEVQKLALHILAFLKFRMLSVGDPADNVSFVVLFFVK